MQDLAPAGPPAPAPNPDGWKGTIGIGLVAIAGNAESLNVNATASMDKKWGEWGFGTRFNGAYGQARSDTTATQVSAYRAALTLRGDRNVSSFASIFLLAGADTDHVKSIEARGFGELGTGIKFYERKEDDLEKLYLRADVGFRYGYETRYQYYGTGAPAPLPSLVTLGPRVAATARTAPSKRFRLSEEAEFIPMVLGPSRYLINSTTKVNARITDGLSFVAALLVAFDSLPAPGKKDTDLTLTMGLEAVF